MVRCGLGMQQCAMQNASYKNFIYARIYRVVIVANTLRAEISHVPKKNEISARRVCS